MTSVCLSFTLRENLSPTGDQKYTKQVKREVRGENEREGRV